MHRCRLLCCLLLLLGAGGLSAAEVQLIGGRLLDMEIVAEDDSSLTLRQQGVRTGMEMKLPKDRVHRLRRTPSGDWEVLNEPPPPPPEPAKPAAEPEPEPEPESATVRYFGWRGDHSGHFPDADPPIAWGDGRMRRWTAPMQGKSNASPVIAGDLIICCDEPHWLVAVAAADGSEVWRQENSLAAAGAPDVVGHQTKWFGTYGWTTPTPVVRDDRVWASFGNGVVACYGLDGERRWIRQVHVGGHSYMTAASGCLVGDRFICYMAREDWVGSIYAFDADSGELDWQQTCRISQGSVVPLTVDGVDHALVAVGDLFRASDGQQVRSMWHGMGKKGRNYGPTPVWDSAGGILVFAIYDGTQSGGKPMRAVRLSTQGEPELLWEYISDPEPHYSGRMHGSPLIHNGIFYARRQDGFFFALDLATGQEVFTAQLPGQNFSSLVRAGPYIFAFGKKEVTIIRSGRTYDEVARFPHGFASFAATPVFAGKRMYVRDAEGLHAYGPEL